jgi:DcuC family C4-dicarboxylate transporter
MVIELISIAIILLTIILLVKQYETRMVLIGSGLVLCAIGGSPMSAFAEFSKYMVSGNLIMAICSSMGFAFVMKFTECDVHLVRVLSKLLTKLGFFLIPAAVIVTFMINIAIPSAAGCAAAVGATLIPLLIASRIHPAIAGAAVLCGTIGSLLSPGLSHNPFVADMSGMSVVDLIARHSHISIGVGLIAAVSLAVVALVKKEFRVALSAEVAQSGSESEQVKVNYLYATAPFVPLVLLVLANTQWLSGFQINVPAAMLIGSIYAMVITFCNPNNATKEFFKGMGSAYGDILGIIIAAAVFSQGLKASGLVDEFISFLINEPDYARWGGTLGPFLMGIMTGSGDAAAYAFNNTVTPHAASLGYQIPDLGMAAAISGALGRTMSPLAGSVIVCAGLAGVNPIELAKRTAPGMIIGVLFVALFML